MQKFPTKKLAVTAMLVAVAVLLSFATVYVSQISRISFGFITNSLCSFLLGPVYGALCAFLSDFLGWLLKPVGDYFPGYALTAILTTLVYSFFLYKKEPKLWRAAAAQLIIVLFLHLGLNTLWGYMRTGPSALAISSARLIQYAIQYPIQVLLIFFFTNMAKRANIKF